MIFQKISLLTEGARRRSHYLVLVCAVYLVAGCDFSGNENAKSGFEYFTQCITDDSNLQHPAVVAALPDLEWRESNKCYALMWKFPRAISILSGESDGGASFSVLFPLPGESAEIDPLLAGQYVVVQPLGMVESYRRTGKWGGSHLVPTGESLHGMKVMRMPKPSRQRFLVGDGYVVMTSLSSDKVIFAEETGISSVRVTLNSGAEAVIRINSKDLPRISSIASALRAQFQSFRVT